MLMYCDLWPKEFEIEKKTGLLLATLGYATFISNNQEFSVLREVHPLIFIHF